MPQLFSENLLELENLLNYRFRNPYLLTQALTHSSYANENSSVSNERLEFLGDIVLGFVVSEFLYSVKPELNEAEMSKIRSYLISRKFLTSISRKFLLGKFLLLGKGERISGGENKDSILANAMEALIGAIYLDGGIEPVKGFIVKTIYEILLSKPFLQLEEQDFSQHLQSMQSP